MARKYNFSITIPVESGFSETLQVVDCDSFDEAIRIVEHEVKQRLVTLSQRINKPAQQAEAPEKPPVNTQVKTPASGPAGNPPAKTSA